jgi:hypothetical protein
LLHKFTNNSPRGFSSVEKCTKKVYGRAKIVTNFQGLLEKEVGHEFSGWFVRSPDYELGSMNLQMSERLT